MSLEFSVPLMPAFYKIDLSDVPSVIALFLMGPASAACVEAVKIIIKLITVGTNTAYVGEFANLLGIALFVIPVWIVYNKCGRTVKGGAWSLVVSLPVRIAFSCFLNGCITLPLYAKAMGMSLDQVVAVVGAVNPYITNLPTFLVLATIPFNLLKLSLNYLAGYLLYTRLKSANVLSHMASE
jgi:riboflavin transporter FmnP